MEIRSITVAALVGLGRFKRSCIQVRLKGFSWLIYIESDAYYGEGLTDEVPPRSMNRTWKGRLYEATDPIDAWPTGNDRQGRQASIHQLLSRPRPPSKNGALFV